MSEAYIETASKMEMLAVELKQLVDTEGGAESVIENYKERIVDTAPDSSLVPDDIVSDAWGKPFEVRDNNGTFYLMSSGADGTMGNSDDVNVSLSTLEVKVDKSYIEISEGMGLMTWCIIGSLVFLLLVVLLYLKQIKE